MSRKIPNTASVAEAVDGSKLFAPSAARNAGPMADFIAQHVPGKGNALEIASGTGQHVTAFATQMPGIHWQPSDIDAERLRSIDAYAAERGLGNVAAAVILNATQPGWAARYAGKDLIVLINLLHLISETEARTLIHEAAMALAPGGAFVFYGPFRRDGALTSEGDQTFDAQLRDADPAIGYKDTREIAEWLSDAGLKAEAFEMPANNLAYVTRKLNT